MAERGGSAPPSPARLLEILDHLGVGYYQSDMDGRITTVNRAGAAMFGCKPEEMIGTSTADFDISPLERDRLRRQVLETGSASSFVRPAPRRDGTLFFMESSLQLLRGDQGRPFGIEGVYRDATLEVELLREQARLLNSLRRSRDNLAHLSTIQEQLLSSLAHDLKTPPVVMQGFAELLLRGRYGALEPAVEKPLRTIHRNVLGLVDMVESVLTFSRLLRSLPDQRGAVSLGRAWFEAMAELASRSPESAIRFSLDSGAGDDEVEASSAALAHMVSHLVQNALALARPGSPLPSTIGPLEGAIQLRIAIPSLDPDRPPLSRLMDSFFWEVHGEGDANQRLLAPGAIRYLATMLGGELHAAGAEDGTAFSLLLPRACITPAPQNPNPKI